jgi:hypothetical protein
MVDSYLRWKLMMHEADPLYHSISSYMGFWAFFEFSPKKFVSVLMI